MKHIDFHLLQYEKARCPSLLNSRRYKINSQKCDLPLSSWNQLLLLFSNEHFILHMFIIAQEQHSIHFLCSIKCLLSVTSTFFHWKIAWIAFFIPEYYYFELCSSRLVEKHNLTNIFSSKLVALLFIASLHLRTVHLQNYSCDVSWFSCVRCHVECVYVRNETAFRLLEPVSAVSLSIKERN